MENKEIERKYLVHNTSFIEQAIKVYHIVQGYISFNPTVRVRLRDREGFLTIKEESDISGLTRTEWEYGIPYEEGKGLMTLCSDKVVEKHRYIVPYEGEVWEVDIFQGRHKGLITAELELNSTTHAYSLPPWVGREVTGDKRYYNAYLSLRSDLPPLD